MCGHEQISHRSGSKKVPGFDLHRDPIDFLLVELSEPPLNKSMIALVAA